MRKTIKLISVILLTIVFITLTSYILSQNNAVEIPYIYLEF